MCGACGRTVRSDQWSGVLSSSRSRWEAARIVNGVLGECGSPVRVTCTAGAWLVRLATGRDLVADTASELWRAVLTVPGVDPGTVGALRARPRTPVAVAVAEAATAVASGSGDGGGAVDPG